MNVQTQIRILAAVDAHGGVLTPDKALPLGISRQLLTDARNEGILDRPIRGVYTRPGFDPMPARTAAVRIGPPLLLSYQGAGNHWGLDAMAPGALQWSVPHRRRAPFDNVFPRRRYDELDVVECDGLLVTSVAQTLADLGYVVDADRVERAMESALRKHLISEEALRAFAAHVSRRPGAPTLRAVLARRPLGAPPTESDFETLALQAYRKGGVPEPIRQFQLYDGDIFVARIDFHWWPIPFGTEFDGLDSHGSREKLQYDLTRGNNIGDARHLIRRFTYADVMRRPMWVCRKTLRGMAVAEETMATNRSRNSRRTA